LGLIFKSQDVREETFFLEILTLEYGTNTSSQNIGYKLADTAQHRRTKISSETSDYLQVTKIMARNECPLP
jgi:hypothetical protein